MVLDLGNKELNEAHEQYLEDKARAGSDRSRYTDQIEISKILDASARKQKDIQCSITIEAQNFSRPYTRLGEAAENMTEFNTKARENIPEKGLDRRTLMKCSTLADEYFSFNPTQDTLLLPVPYPRQNPPYGGIQDLEAYNADYPYPIEPGKRYIYLYNCHRAHIRADEIELHIIPWLKKMEKVVHDMDSGKHKGKPGKRKRLPNIETPKTLLEKIHLYNAMLQLGLPRFVQQPLIHALIQQMHVTRLQECELSTLEMTICRFHSRAMPILDPVLNYFIGTYSERKPSDRQHAKKMITRKKREQTSEESRNEGEMVYYPEGKKRKLLDYTSFAAKRQKFKRDTVLFPPELEVLGQSVRHWSGVRRDGSTSAVQFPLGVWRVPTLEGEGTKQVENKTTETTKTVETTETTEKSA